MLLGLIGSPSRKEIKPARPSSFHQPFPSKRRQEVWISKEDVGKRVSVGERSGTLRFVGKTCLGPGLWCGIELDSPFGDSDGSLTGIRYFVCSPDKGMFVHQQEVTLSPIEEPVNVTPEISIKRYSLLSDSQTSPLAVQELSRISKNSSSSSSLIPSRGTDPGCHSKHSSFECDDSLGILTPDQMDDTLNLLDEKSLTVPSLITQEDLTLASLTDSDNHLVKSNTISKFDDSINEHPFCDEIKTVKSMSKSQPTSPTDTLVASDNLRDSQEEERNFPEKKDICFEEKKVFEPIQRTPSTEELPLDCDEQRDQNQAKVVALPNSFITSVTSITSLDNGYQGDGEWSRPASRGADHSPSAHQKLVKPRMDAMTDSDFFTESDADVYDELVLGRGDRRAQVIDGTLYGASPSQVSTRQRPQRFSPTCEEMDSSGIYSDFDRRPEESETKSISDEMDITQIERTISPTGSTRTISSKSDQSLKKLSPTSISSMIIEQVKNLMVMEVEPPENSNTEELETIMSPPEKQNTQIKNETNVKKYKMPKRNVVSKIKTMISSNVTRKENEIENKCNNRTQKKGRWDAVMSKISQGQPEDKSKLKEVKSRVFSGLAMRPGSATPIRNNLSPRGLTSAQSTRSLRDIQPMKPLKGRRCRLRSSDCSLVTPSAAGSRTPASSRNSSISDVSQATKASLAPTGSVKKRETTRSGSPPSEGSSAKKPAVSSTAKCLRPNQVKPGVQTEKNVRKNSTRRAPTANSAQTKAPSPREDPVLKNKSEQKQDESQVVGKAEVCHEVPAPPAVPPVDLDGALLALRHSALGFDALAALVNHLVVNLEAYSVSDLKDSVKKTKFELIQTKLELEETRSSYRRLENEYNDKRLKHLEKECEQSKEIEELKNVLSSYQREVQELICKIQEQEDELVALSSKHDAKTAELEETNRQMQKRVEDTENLLDETRNRETEIRKELSDVQILYDDLKKSKQLCLEPIPTSEKEPRLKGLLQQNSGLVSEVDSLRCVLELRSSELQELRRKSQSWKMDSDELPQAKQTIKAYKAKIEELTEKLNQKENHEQKLLKENKALNQSMGHIQVQNKRLSLTNEELQWKLKQNSKVVQVLANMTVDQKIYHSPEMRNARKLQRNSSFKAFETEDNDSMWSVDSKLSESLPNSPKVKGLVERGDSVAWILDMEEPAESMLSRLTKRASQRISESKEEVVVVKDDDISIYDMDESMIVEDGNRLRPKSNEELEMLRRVEESRGGLPKDLAGEAMVSGGTSDDDMVLDSPLRSPQPNGLHIAWAN